jgi:hypothetical protein
MVRWVAAFSVAAIIVAFSSLGRGANRVSPAMAVVAASRLVALTLLVAMLVGAPFGTSSAEAPLVLLDRSASWQRADDGSRWRVAVDSARAITARTAGIAGDDAVLTVGDSVVWVARDELSALSPRDTTTRLADAVEAATVRGRPVVLITDGELGGLWADGPLPPGSRTVRIGGTPRVDAAVAQLVAPAVASAGDTIRVRVTVAVGAVPLAPAELRILRDDLGSTPVTRRALPALDAWSTYVVDLLVPLGALPPSRATPTESVARALAAVLAVDGDIEPRNDTLLVRVEQTPQPRIVFVSTAPDLDVREALRVLRGISGVQLQAYLRVAPGQWRVEGPLSRIEESTVVQRARAATIAIVHGDSVWADAQRVASAVLWTPAPPPPPVRAGELTRRTEWFLREAPPSVQSPPLTALPWDSLTPLLLDPAISAGVPSARGASPWLIARAGKTGAAAVVVWQEDARLRINGSGFAAWVMRGAASRDAFDALWGAIFDQASREQLTNDRSPRVASSDTVSDSAASPRFDVCVAQAVPVHCERTATSVRAAMQREWVPSPPMELSVTPGPSAFTGRPLRLIQHAWPFVLVVVALSAEWLLRRRLGFR